MGLRWSLWEDFKYKGDWFSFHGYLRDINFGKLNQQTFETWSFAYHVWHNYTDDLHRSLVNEVAKVLDSNACTPCSVFYSIASFYGAFINFQSIDNVIRLLDFTVSILTLTLVALTMKLVTLIWWFLPWWPWPWTSLPGRCLILSFLLRLLLCVIFLMLVLLLLLWNVLHCYRLT